MWRARIALYAAPRTDDSKASVERQSSIAQPAAEPVCERSASAMIATCPSVESGHVDQGHGGENIGRIKGAFWAPRQVPLSQAGAIRVHGGAHGDGHPPPAAHFHCPAAGFLASSSSELSAPRPKAHAALRPIPRTSTHLRPRSAKLGWHTR